MRVVFFGSGEFGLPTLRRLAERGAVVGVVTQPDRPAGRGGRTLPTPIGAWAQENLGGVPILKPERVRDAAMVRQIREMAGVGAGGTSAACMVVIAFGQKLPAELLRGWFALNLHASLLPRWRGAAPINAAILAGDAETGNSVITIAERMDAGEVLGQTRRAITPELTAGDLHDLLAGDGPGLVERVLGEWERGALRGVAQDEALVTKAPKLAKEDGWVDFAAGAEECRRRIHGLTPWPGVTVRFRDEALKLLRAKTERDGEMGAPGGAVVDAGEGLVACGDGTRLRLLEVQPAGKRGMGWRDFANGHRVARGEVLVGGRGNRC